jgi:hypothetical protein
VGLRHCPFLELAEARAQVVCRVHLGLMQGAMGAWGTSLTVHRLEPFAEPGPCAAHLSAAGPAAFSCSPPDGFRTWWWSLRGPAGQQCLKQRTSGFDDNRYG